MLNGFISPLITAVVTLFRETTSSLLYDASFMTSESDLPRSQDLGLIKRGTAEPRVELDTATRCVTYTRESSEYYLSIVISSAAMLEVRLLATNRPLQISLNRRRPVTEYH